MSKENEKNFNEMLRNNKDMPKIIEIKDLNTINKYHGSNMLIAPPLSYDEEMKKVPFGKLTTISAIRANLAKTFNTNFTDPMTAGIFVNIVAWASYQRDKDVTPFWRTLKADGELNAKYPQAFELQKNKLEEEGHIIIKKGKTKIKYYVKDYEDKLI